MDLSVPDRKIFVRGVFEGYLRSLPSQDEEAQQQQDGAGEEGQGTHEEEEEEEGGRGTKREYDDVGDLILCRLAANRKVTLQEFRGKKLVSIRESYSKDGKELPTAKGISLTVEQWEAFRNAVPAVEDAIKKLGESG
uniref:KELP n=1 Tax=Arundo donax TaxID=35708 RepID=A0A0A9DIG9_ARUDO